MSFVSISFLAFFIVVLIVTCVIDRTSIPHLRSIFLLVSSYVFYGYWDYRFCALLLFVTVCAYITGLFVQKRVVYIAGIVAPLVVLGVFKYLNFFISSAARAFGNAQASLNIILPVGISFYTFQALSYVIDVHRGKINAERDFFKLALYIAFFPQLVAGPIIRGSDFLPQLNEDRKVELSNVKWGIQVFAFGLFKKIVLADHLSVFVDEVYATPAVFHWTTIILACFAYSLQIYLDFSGYSDMAIGCAKCLGFDFKKNFNLPYISKNVTEFWRRWHISLSTWLKEYLYIPLGGNRKGKSRQLINLFITMLLGGLWHGAEWTFLIWGGINGIALCLNKLIRKDPDKDEARIVKTMFTFVFITFTWIFFRAENVYNAWEVIRGICTFQNGVRHYYVWTYISVIILLIATAYAINKSDDKVFVDGFYPILDLGSFIGTTIFFVELGIILGLAYTGSNPFVYFQF